MTPEGQAAGLGLTPTCDAARMIERTGDTEDGLTVTHEPEGSLDICLLRVTARANEFAGSSSAYFNDSAVLEFATRLAGFPLPKGEPVGISGGAGDEEYVGIEASPAGHFGQVSVVVHLADPWPSRVRNARSDVRLEILTTYERMLQFSADLARVVTGEIAEARLGHEQLRVAGRDS